MTPLRGTHDSAPPPSRGDSLQDLIPQPGFAVFRPKSAEPRQRPLSPLPGPAGRKRVLLTFAPLSCFAPPWYHALQKSQLFSSKNSTICQDFGTDKMRAAKAARIASGWLGDYCAAARSQERMTPFSSSKVVVLTMWVLPTRISWLPSSLVRLSFTVASMVKTRS